MKTPYKTSLTTKPYTVDYKGYTITVPAGSRVSNKTAMGNDDNYHFWQGWSAQIEELTGFKNSILAHDLTYYGLNIPAEYCEPYEGLKNTVKTQFSVCIGAKVVDGLTLEADTKISTTAAMEIYKTKSFPTGVTGFCYCGVDAFSETEKEQMKLKES